MSLDVERKNFVVDIFKHHEYPKRAFSRPHNDSLILVDIIGQRQTRK